MLEIELMSVSVVAEYGGTGTETGPTTDSKARTSREAKFEVNDRAGRLRGDLMTVRDRRFRRKIEIVAFIGGSLSS
jgi:hypothetical protein